MAAEAGPAALITAAAGPVALTAAAAGYVLLAVPLHRRGRWPAYRTALWCAGLAAVGAATAPVVDAAADRDFTVHVAGHLLLGMVAPLLLVCAAPVTLLLRALPVGSARTVVRLLRSAPAGTAAHPVTAAALTSGGAWLLYTTPLYSATGRHALLHLAVHVHMLASGYLFAYAVAGADPAPHRAAPPIRAAVLLLYLAAHAILAKYLYGHPPPGVPVAQARAGAVLMYYGGDAADLGLLVVFCRKWLGTARTRADRPRRIGWRAVGRARA